MRYTSLGCSYELEQPVEVDLDHDDVLASGDGCVYVHEPFVGVREGLYLFNWKASTPGIAAIEGFIRFDTFERPQFVSKEEATHVYWEGPQSPASSFFHELEDFQHGVKYGAYLPVRREQSQLTETREPQNVWQADFDWSRKEWSEADIAEFMANHDADLDAYVKQENRKEAWL